MNEQMQQFARDTLKTGLAKLPTNYRRIFNRMYSPADLEASVDDVVDDMPEEKLDRAMQQVQRSLQKLEAKGESSMSEHRSRKSSNVGFTETGADELTGTGKEKCQAGYEIDTGPCAKCGATGDELCGELEGTTSPEGLEINRLKARNVELADALELILPLAKGYAAAHPVGSNDKYVNIAEAAMAKNKGEAA